MLGLQTHCLQCWRSERAAHCLEPACSGKGCRRGVLHTTTASVAEAGHSWQALPAASLANCNIVTRGYSPSVQRLPACASHNTFLLQFTSQQGLPWLGAAVAAIPEAVATAEDKHKVLAAAQQLLNPPEASNPRT